MISLSEESQADVRLKQFLAIGFFSSKNWNLSDQIFAILVIWPVTFEPETRYDQAKTNLVGHYDHWLTGRYVKPCFFAYIFVQNGLTYAGLWSSHLKLNNWYRCQSEPINYYDQATIDFTYDIENYCKKNLMPFFSSTAKIQSLCGQNPSHDCWVLWSYHGVNIRRINGCAFKNWVSKEHINANQQD